MKPKFSPQASEVKASQWMSAPLVVSFISLIVLVVSVVMLSQSSGVNGSGLAGSLRHQSFDPAVLLVHTGEAVSEAWIQLIQTAGS
ncbi:hypothetical protein [Marinobacter mobilis]|uniref:hypothetical protein n=1 Tax=Marinobacter mobilis TaxID=488533 RepID=UPI0035C72ED7